MPPIKIKLPDDFDVKALGEDRTVELDEAALVALPQGYLTPKQAKDYLPKTNVETMIKERLAGQADALRSQLADDDAFVRGVLQARNVPLDEDGNVKFPDKGFDVKDLQRQIAEAKAATAKTLEEQKLKPLQTENERLKATLQRDRRMNLHSEIVQTATQLGVRKDKFKTLPNAPRHKAPVITNTEDLFGWYEPADGKGEAYWALKDSSGSFVVNAKEVPGRPYAGVEHLFQSMREDPAIEQDWFEDNRPAGPDGGQNLSEPSRPPSEVSDKDRYAQLTAMNKGERASGNTAVIH